MFAYVRLAGGCFGCGENEAGYDALERCLALCEIYSNIPEGTELPFNSPVLDEISQERGGGHSIFGHVIAPLTEYDGWEWFDCVRDEERYKQIVAKLTRIYEEMAAKEALRAASGQSAAYCASAQAPGACGKLAVSPRNGIFF